MSLFRGGKARASVLLRVVQGLLPVLALSTLASPTKAEDKEAPKVSVRNLQGDDAKRVDELTKKIGELEQAGKFAQARVVALEILTLRSRVQGSDHWQTGDARREVEKLGQIAAMPEAAQAKLASAARLTADAEVDSEKGNYAQAQVLNEQALQIRRQLLGEEHLDTAESYNDLGAALKEQGKYAKAQSMLQMAGELYRRLLGEDHTRLAASYNELAANLNDQGNFAEAQLLLQKALAIRRRVLGEEHADTARLYNNLASNLDSQGKHAEAERLLRKALEIRQHVLGEDHVDTANSYNNLASNLDDQRRHAEAQPLYQKTLRFCRRHLGEEHPYTILSYNNVASNLDDQGKYTEAQSLYERVLALRERVLGKEHPRTALSYHNLGSFLHARGKHAEAERNLRQAVAIRTKVLGENHPDTTSSHNGLASNLYDQGKYLEAEATWTRAAASFKVARLAIAYAGLERAAFSAVNSPLPSLAAVLARRARNREAWHYLEENLARGLFDDLAARQRSLSPTEQQRQQELLTKLQGMNEQIVRVLSEKQLSPEERRKKVLEFARQRDTIEAELTQLDHDLVAKHGVAVGKVYDLAAIQARLPADAALLAWVDIKARANAADQNGEHWACIVTRNREPEWVRITGSDPKGNWTNDDDRLLDEVREKVATRPRDTRGEWQESTRRLSRQRLTPVERSLSHRPERPAIRHLIILPSPQMARIPVETLTDRYTVSYAPSGTMFAWLQEQRQTAESSGSQNPPPTLLALGDPVFETLESAPSPPDFGAMIAVVAPDSVGDPARLKPGDVVLRYGRAELSRPAAAEDVVRQVNDEQTYASGAAAHPRGETDIALEVWRDGQTLKLTVKPGKLGVLFSPKPVGEAVKDRHLEGNLVRELRGKSLPALPGTRIEVEAISRLFANPTRLLGAEASKQRLDQLVSSKKLHQFRFLHFATHGNMHTQIAMKSALMLARKPSSTSLGELLPDQEAYDDRLTAGDILQSWQLNADLVTLSACQTGLGKDAGGEGYLGFAQALFCAGARSLVLSLWKVDDEATALLMERFYKNLLGRRADLKGLLPKAEALDEAKSWLRGLTSSERDRLRRRDPGRARGPVEILPPLLEGADAAKAAVGDADHPFAHPYYWAAFILVGDPN